MITWEKDSITIARPPMIRGLYLSLAIPMLLGTLIPIAELA